MNAFTEKGLTRQVQLKEGKFRYELDSGVDHHHLVCTNCGKIEDISDCNITDLVLDIEKKKGFSVFNHALEFYGICKTCMDKDSIA